MKNPARSFFLIFMLAFAAACNTGKSAKKPAQVNTSKPAPTPKPASTPDVPVSPGATNVAWLDSDRLMPVLEQAIRENRVVFVEFYASWCAPCKVMEEDVFTQPVVSEYLNSNFLNFHTNFDSPTGQTIAAIYEVDKLPTVLFLAPNGVVLERHLGIANPSLLKTMGDSALGKLGK